MRKLVIALVTGLFVVINQQLVAPTASAAEISVVAETELGWCDLFPWLPGC